MHAARKAAKQTNNLNKPIIQRIETARKQKQERTRGKVYV